MIIPRVLHHIWVGERPPPYEWLNTWREFHKDWQYILWDNEKVFGRKWYNQEVLEFYKEKKQWHGVADVVRYEILNEYGGFMSGADCICLSNIEELLQDDRYDCYSVYENEIVRKGLVSPIQASTKDSEFLKIIIKELHNKKISELGMPWKTTGNLFMKKLITKYNPARLKIWPSYILIPRHYTGLEYKGKEKIYGRQMFAQTLNLYKQ